MPKGKGYAGEVGQMIKGAIKDGTITQKQADKLPEHLITAIIKKKRGHAGVKPKPKSKAPTEMARKKGQTRKMKPSGKPKGKKGKK